MFFFSSRRRHTRWPRDWSSDVCSSDLFFHDVLSPNGKRSRDFRWMEPKLSLGGTFFHCGAPNKFRSGLVEPASLRQYSGLSRDGLGNSFGRTSMSGVVGVVGKTGVNQLLYDALTVLQ